jgi:bile acid:Na+ symporter, BASS family
MSFFWWPAWLSGAGREAAERTRLSEPGRCPIPRIRAVLASRNVIFALAVGLGLVLPGAAEWLRPLILPALAVVLTISTLGVGNELFRRPGTLIVPSLTGILLNYLILGNVIVVLSAVLIREDLLWKGFVLMAAVPPAVAVIPFTSYLRGNLFVSLVGTVGGYLGGLVLMPLMLVVLLGGSLADPALLVQHALVLILLPLAASRLILWKGWQSRIRPVRGALTNWGFFLVVYAITGLNQDILVRNPGVLLPIAAVAFAATFVLGFLVERVARLLHLTDETTTSLVLLGTLKNYGLTGGLALSLFGREAALPAAVGSLFLILYYLWLSQRRGGVTPAEARDEEMARASAEKAEGVSGS